ncbi:MAG: hypothetical protein IKO47_05700 [Ruminococcus sp.]|nr:hypothetical protein [Ruminococcus sp.]
MALINCPECGREGVSSTANSCPQCGFNVKKYYAKQSESIIEESYVDNDNESLVQDIDMMHICPKCYNVLASYPKGKTVCNMCGTEMLLTDMTVEEFINIDGGEIELKERYCNETGNILQRTRPAYKSKNQSLAIPATSDSLPSKTSEYGFHYCISLIIPLIGFIIGSIMLCDSDEKKRYVGKTCIILSLISVITVFVLIKYL